MQTFFCQMFSAQSMVLVIETLFHFIRSCTVIYRCVDEAKLYFTLKHFTVAKRAFNLSGM